MARPLAVPFALPGCAAAPQRASPLGMPQFIVLLAGVLLVPAIILVLIYPVGLDFLAKDNVRAHRAAFGFDVGGLATDTGDTTWGITRVTPGGLADRAGLRAGDVIFTYHGTPASFLEWALHAASTGTEACLEVANMPARLAGMRLDRTVCLGSARTADPMAPSCPLPSPAGICPAPMGGDVLIWREPVHENGRHALVLRPADGSPEVLVRAFEQSVDVLWSPDGRAVAIADHEAGDDSAVWVHWGPLLSRQADLAGLIAATLYFPDHFMVYPHRWENASTLRLAAGQPARITPVPMHYFRYRLGEALTRLP